MKCIACQQKIKISQVMITAPIGDVCGPCAKAGWEIYETGKGLALRQRSTEKQPRPVSGIQMAMEF